MCQTPGQAARPPTVAGGDSAPVKAVAPPKRETRSGARRLPSLSGLRFAASCAVVYTHSMLLIEPRLADTPGPEVWAGGSAVSLFFMLSGFVLTHAARPGDTTAAFWWRRAAKILPNHVLTWCVAVAALAGTGALAASVPAIAAELSSLLLVQTWVPSQRFVSAGNPVSWTLAAEVFFYLLFPVLLRWVRRLSGRGLVVGAATAVAVVWALPVLCEVVVNPGRSFFMDYWFLYMLPISRLPEFVLGMLAARICRMGVRLPRSGVLLAALSVISTIVVSSSYLPHPFMFAAATVVPMVVLVHATAELDLRGKPSLLRWRPVVFLGEMSYAVYLVHLMVLGVAYVSLTSRGWSGLQAVLAALPMALLASYLLYVGVERPCMRRLLALSGRAVRRTEPVDSTHPGRSDTPHGPIPETAEDRSRADAGHRRRGERTTHRTRANDEPPDATPPTARRKGPAGMTTRSKRVADGRPRYQQDLAQGLERFFEPRQAACPWCGSRCVYRRLRTVDCLQRKPGTFVLDQCGSCRHVFQNPRLNAAGLEFYYRDCYDGLGEATMARLASSPIAVRLHRARARALLPLSRPDRWLDVGTGHGHFCAIARKIHPDTEFDGLDIGEGVEIAARRGRITRAYRGAFPDLSGQLSGRYDVVSMYHYLEHTVAPRKELTAAHTALRPGGHLLVEVPDPQSAAARLFGRWWGPWLQPQHLHFIPMENLCSALTAQGFTVVATDRREPHIPTDLTSAAVNALTCVLPSADVPWLPEKPGLLSRAVRPVALLVSAPMLAALFGLDLLLTPLVRGTRFANAYRVVARRD